MRSKFKMPLSRMLKGQQRLSRMFLKAAGLSGGALSTRVPKIKAPAAKLAVKGRLEPVATFGSNPGRLHMYRYIPAALPKKAPLVVVLHGCHQSAEEYDHHSGWSTLARERGFALVYAEQTRSNNGNLCFNWFRPSNVTRDRGEVMSIRQMIAKMAALHGIDRKRVYITGLSAGGAMTASMLATYPELFAGGAIIAGLPHGAARDVQRAVDAMREAPVRTAEEWGDHVRTASPSLARLPLISIWHGTKDRTVAMSNAHALLDQWLNVCGLDPSAYVETVVDGHIRRVWHDKRGQPAVEFYQIEGMGHGTPLKPRAASRPRADTPGRFMLDAGISSSTHLAKTWGLKKPSILPVLKAPMRKI